MKSPIKYRDLPIASYAKLPYHAVLQCTHSYYTDLCFATINIVLLADMNFGDCSIRVY